MVRLGCVGLQWSALNLINLMKEAIKNGQSTQSTLSTRYRTKINDCQIVRQHSGNSNFALRMSIHILIKEKIYFMEVNL